MPESDDELMERARGRVGHLLAGKYRIERVLGVGGMAAVYAATHRNGRSVAVKMLHPELALRSDIRQRFIRESHAANRVLHPGVVAVIDDDVAEDGSTFLVMELLSGQSVEEMWLEGGQRLPVATVLSIARELCGVLAVAHGAGIVHRDIKPANLFVTNDGILKVLDFGIARVRDVASAKLTDTGMMLGTPAFMAPEQAAGRVNDIDERTDVWAVGATMFVLLSGTVVHEAQSPQHMIVLSATSDARSLAAVAPTLPPEIIRVVDRALARDPAARWPSATALAAAIGGVSRALYGKEVLRIERVSATLKAAAPLAIARRGEDEVAQRQERVVGTTTSSPVSSSAPTKPGKRLARAVTLRIRHFLRTLPIGRREGLAVQAPKVAPNGVTPDRGRHVRTGVVATLALVLGAVLVVSTALTMRSKGGPSVPREATPSGATPSTGPALEPAPSTRPTTPADLPSARITPEDLPSATPPASATVARSGAAPSRPPAHRGRRPATTEPSNAKPAPTSGQRRECATPYVIDDAGKMTFKKECL